MIIGQGQALGFAGGRWDRADAMRAAPERIAAAFADPSARLVLLDGLDPVEDGTGLAATPLPPGANVADYIFLGLGEHGPLFAALPSAPLSGFRRPSGRVREAAARLSADALALFGAARSLVDWHARHRFCSSCGVATAPVRGGWSRRCDGCAAEHFPRVDPVVIMLAEHDGHALVGRQHGWAPGFYSALAGFLEPGETMEEAVARELEEEAGVRVSSVRYVMSQPWPFPSSLMLACIAKVDNLDIRIDEAELEHAMWVARSGVVAALSGEPHAPFAAPQPMAVAYHLLRHWVDEGR